MFELRQYQRDCIDALNDYLRASQGRPLASLPTGSGKTIIFCHMIKEWLAQWPDTRVCILAHRQELLAQAEKKMLRVWPEAPISIYSAGLKRKETAGNIVIGGIQSIYRNLDKFEPFNVIIVDECHLIPTKKDTMYRSFLDACLEANPKTRVMGFTATPYRLDGGDLAGHQADRFFDEVTYEADIISMIKEGYLCNLRTKGTETRMEVKGIHRRGGDFIQAELDARFSDQALVDKACDEMVKMGKDRKSWLVFCCGIKHAEAITIGLQERGVDADTVFGTTAKEDRADTLEAFEAGDLRAVVNVNCLTTGLDVERIDLIAMLRPTQSTSLWVQSVGRGFRPFPGKEDCLVMDFGGNTWRHGPLNNLRIKKKGGDGSGPAPLKMCPKCMEIVPLATRECACGYVFKEKEFNHEAVPSDLALLTEDKTETLEIDRVTFIRHGKEGKPDSIRVNYWSGFRSFSEWVCPDHGGYARKKAQAWFEKRGFRVDLTVDEFFQKSFRDYASNFLTGITKKIRVKQDGKYTRIERVDIDRSQVSQWATFVGTEDF